MSFATRYQTWRWCLFAGFLFCGQASQTVFSQETSSGRRLAVVIGVNSYRPNSGLGHLKHATKDAGRLSAVLRKSGYTVTEMSHEVAREPGKEVLAPYLVNIRDQISGVLETPNLGKQDAVLISLHGHGVHFNLRETVMQNGVPVERRTPKFYFCPADASVREVTSANDLTDKNSLLPLDELYEALGECKAATKLLIVDACRNDPNQSGVFRDGEIKSLTMPKIPPPPGGLAAFLSCRESQRAVEDNDLGQDGQGVFTHFLIQGLEGKADLPLEGGKSPDGIVTLSELTTYTANNTYAYVLKKYAGVKQSPEIKGEFDANLAIVQLPVEDPDYVRGLALLRGIDSKIDGATATIYLRKAADKDHPLAMAQLAYLYQIGEYVVKDITAATRLAGRSRPRLDEMAQAGRSDAQFYLGLFYEFEVGCQKDLQLAFSWLRKAAAQNHLGAQLHLGMMYEEGEGVQKDPVEAVQWYRKAAIQNYADAQIHLGRMYQEGEGVTKDLDEAVRWYRKAVEQNDPEALFQLGQMYQGGEGVPRDLAESVRLYRKAAEQGIMYAQANLAALYQEGDGVAKDPVEALRWYRKAADQGYAYAQNQLGWIYQNGEGVAKNPTEAIKWYLLAADQNEAAAQNNLGRMYQDGDGVPENFAEAAKWFRKAAEQGSAEAQVSLGYLYQSGQGVTESAIEAEKWFRKALANPEADADTKKLAQEALTEMGKNP